MIDPTGTDGAILVLEGLEALTVEVLPDLSSFEWHREHRLAAQRALATFLQTGAAEVGGFSPPRIDGPIWIVCCQTESAPGWRHAGSGLDGAGLISELQDCLQETVRLGSPSVRAMVSMLRDHFAEQTIVRREDTELFDELTITIPDATLWTAAHLARSRNASAGFARVMIEEAIRRMLLQLDGSPAAGAVVIAPDDLTRH